METILVDISCFPTTPLVLHTLPRVSLSSECILIIFFISLPCLFQILPHFLFIFSLSMLLMAMLFLTFVFHLFVLLISVLNVTPLTSFLILFFFLPCITFNLYLLILLLFAASLLFLSLHAHIHFCLVLFPLFFLLSLHVSIHSFSPCFSLLLFPLSLHATAA